MPPHDDETRDFHPTPRSPSGPMQLPAAELMAELLRTVRQLDRKVDELKTSIETERRTVDDRLASGRTEFALLNAWKEQIEQRIGSLEQMKDAAMTTALSKAASFILFLLGVIGIACTIIINWK